MVLVAVAFVTGCIIIPVNIYFGVRVTQSPVWPWFGLMILAAAFLFLIFYLVMLLYGSISSTQYALQYGETSYSAWSPYMAPIKIIMVIGIFLMLLQAIATWFKNIAAARGEPLS